MLAPARVDLGERGGANRRDVVGLVGRFVAPGNGVVVAIVIAVVIAVVVDLGVGARVGAVRAVIVVDVGAKDGAVTPEGDELCGDGKEKREVNEGAPRLSREPLPRPGSDRERFDPESDCLRGARRF